MRLLSGLIILVIMISAEAALPEKAMQIKKIIAVSEYWEEATNKDLTGFYWDLIRKIYEPMGAEYAFTVVPYVRGVAMVKNRQAHFWVASYNEEQDFALYPKHYFDKDAISVLYNQTLLNWTGDETLRTKQFAWVRGYNYERFFKFPIKFLESDTLAAAIKMLSVGRVDGVFDSASEIVPVIDDKDFDQNLRSKLILKHLFDGELYMAYANSDEGKILMEVWDMRMEEMKNNGELKDFYNKYSYTAYPY